VGSNAAQECAATTPGCVVERLRLGANNIFSEQACPFVGHSRSDSKK